MQSQILVFNNDSGTFLVPLAAGEEKEEGARLPAPQAGTSPWGGQHLALRQRDASPAPSPAHALCGVNITSFTGSCPMIQKPAVYCDCCGLPVDPLTMEDCPRCKYPVNPAKETRFLESTIHDLQRVAYYGGANIRVVELIHRYQWRLNHLLRMKIMPASTMPSVPVVPQSIEVIPAHPSASTTRTQMEGVPSPVSFPVTPEQRQVPVAAAQQGQQAPGRVFSWRSFFADQVINVVASLGAFLILAGSLSFTATTSNLLLSFLVVFAVHAVFGVTGFITYRFPNFRVVATIYTVIFALLVPLVGFSTYRLLSGNHIDFSLPVLVAIAATYAAIAYTVLAIYQRFTLFAYMGMTALIVADLALANALKLTYWWWPAMTMLLAIPALISVPQRTGRLFTGAQEVLRDPVRFVMYVLVTASASGTGITILYSLQLDAIAAPLREIRFAILSTMLLLLLWTSLFLWLTKRTRNVIVLAYLLLVSVLAACYAFAFEPIGYALALTGVALLYHGLNRLARRRLQPFGVLSPGLDQIALGLVFLVPIISSPLLPLQLLVNVYGPAVGAASPLHFQASWQVVAELIAVGLGVILSIDVTLDRAGSGRAPSKAAWCWLLLLSGFLLNWEYGIVVLALNIAPAWSFLGFTLVIMACAIAVRRLSGTAWANPLDVLALSDIAFTLSLSLNQNRDTISILLLSFAILLYAVLLYQRRQNWLFLPLIFAVLALPALWHRPFAMLLIGVLLPLASVAIRQLVSHSRNVAQAEAPANLNLANMWEWPLLAVGLVYGVVVAANDVAFSTSALQIAFGVHVPFPLELALLSLAWYASAALARVKLWLVPSVAFATGAVLIPTNSFWVLLSLAPVIAVLAVGISRFAGKDWALPVYTIALLSAVMTGYTGFTQDHLVATSWALLGFAALAYSIGVVENTRVASWMMPIFATWSVIVSAGFLGDLYRLPIVALVCAALGVSVGLLNLVALPYIGSRSRNGFLTYALPFYATALAAAVLTGVYGTLANINRPFYGAVPDAMLLYAVIAFAVLAFEQRPRWLWLVAGFAIWGASLTVELTAYYEFGIGIGVTVVGLLVERVMKRPVTSAATATFMQSARRFTWSWPWYVTGLVAAILTGDWASLSVNQPFTSGFIGYSLLAFTALALLIMLVERTPELLVFPAGLAAWTIWLWRPSLDLASLMTAYSLLCVLIFASQFIWRLIPPVTRWLPATRSQEILGIGGQVLVVLVIIGQGGLSAASGRLVHVGAGSLLALTILLFWYGRLYVSNAARMFSSTDDEGMQVKRLQRARAVEHWCNYAAGLLISLVVSWELAAFHQTRFDVLSLASASYLIVIAPFLMRDETLPERRGFGQVVSLLGASLLLLPALWFSFGGNNLTPTLILVGESTALLLLGIATRIRIFVLSSVALLIVGTLRALFLSTPPSLALMVLGGTLLAIATALFLVRHRLQVAWARWE